MDCLKWQAFLIMMIVIDNQTTTSTAFTRALADAETQTNTVSSMEVDVSMATVDTVKKLGRFAMATVDTTDTGVEKQKQTERVFMTTSDAISIDALRKSDHLGKTASDAPGAAVTTTTASTTSESHKEKVVFSPKTSTQGGGLSVTVDPASKEELSSSIDTPGEGLPATTNLSGERILAINATSSQGRSPNTMTPGRRLSPKTSTPGEIVSAGSSCPQTDSVLLLFTADTGNIVWDEASCPGSCDPCDIVLHVPEDHELTVEFHHVNLWFEPGLDHRRDVRDFDEERWVASDRLTVGCVERTGSCLTDTVLRDVRGSLPVAPLWAQDVSQLRLRLSTTWHNLTHRRYASAFTDDVFVTFVPTSRFNISFQAKRRAWVPWSHLLSPSDQPGPYWSYCKWGFRPPEFLLCNGIIQCYYISAEDDFRATMTSLLDETACQHMPQGCGSLRTPFRDECFEVRFMISDRSGMGRCLMDSMDTAAFLDPYTRQFVARKAILTGQRHVAMGVERMRSIDSPHRDLYRYMWWWKPYRTVVHDPSLEQYAHFTHDCAAMRVSLSGHRSLRSVPCSQLTTGQYLTLCHKYNPDRLFTFRAVKLQLSPATFVPSKFPTKLCPGGFHVQPFHSCHASSADETQLSELGLPLLDCDNGARVHYSLTCDGNDDCGDGSDETRCDSVKEWIHHTAAKGRFFFCRLSLEAVDIEKRCDGMADCRDGSDEVQCTLCRSDNDLLVLRANLGACVHHRWENYQTSITGRTGVPNKFVTIASSRQRPIMEKLERWRVELDGFGGSFVVRLSEGQRCPETHVRCPNAYCIPSYMLNNGVYDCPFLHTDDEYVADNFTCPGFYRCYRSHICVHNHYLCDGVYHCPFKDDERYCHGNRTCPENCTCEGLAMRCSEMIDPVQYVSVRYLDLSGSHQPQLRDVHLMGFLQFLNLSGCSLHDLTLVHLEHLKVLDVSVNHLHNLTSLGLTGMVSLRHLDLSDNPGLLKTHGLLKDTLISSGKQLVLKTLVVQNTGITSVEADMFQAVSGLQVLDLRRNNIVKYAKSSFTGLDSLGLLQTDDMKLCCVYSAVFPESTASCQAPVDELSSCSDLLGSRFFRVCLWLLALLAVAGNGIVLVYRLFFEKHRTASAFKVLVYNLCVSDFAMGVYLTIIGSADVHFSGEYLWKEREWTRSGACKAAGFLGMLASEVSAFIICLITLDRLLVLRFPLTRRLHLTWKSAQGVCLVAWLMGMVLSAVPLLPFVDHWHFYSQTGICLPLPITRRQFPGQAYSFAVFIGLNFVLFLLIGLGQLTIYLAVHNAPLAGRTQRRQQDMAIARSLFLVVLTDFCCWFPVGVMGLMASSGISIPGELNVWTAVFVLPLNSALNPFLYTINTALEKRRKQREMQRHQSFMTSLQSDVTTWPAERMDEVARNIVTTRRLDISAWSAEQVKRLVSSLPSDRVEELCRQLSVRGPAQEDTHL